MIHLAEGLPGAWGLVNAGYQVRAEERYFPADSERFHGVSDQDGQEMDKSAAPPICCPAKLLPELVELTGIEPVTS